MPLWLDPTCGWITKVRFCLIVSPSAMVRRNDIHESFYYFSCLIRIASSRLGLLFFSFAHSWDDTDTQHRHLVVIVAWNANVHKVPFKKVGKINFFFSFIQSCLSLAATRRSWRTKMFCYVFNVISISSVRWLLACTHNFSAYNNKKFVFSHNSLEFTSKHDFDTLKFKYRSIKTNRKRV